MPSDPPEDATVSKAFRHRLNPDGTHYSVCTLCYQRVGTCEDEADLAAAEFFHHLECWNKPPGKIRS